METQQTQQKKLPKLTKKQRIFVKEYIKEENGQKAALKAYNIDSKHGTKDPENVARAIASQNLIKLNVKQAIEIQQKSLKEALLAEGITPEYLAGKVNVLLQAKNGDNPDVNAIDKGLKHATNIYGIENIEDKPKVNNTYNFIFSEEVQQQVRIANEIIKAKLIKNENIQKD
jgi:phage terminase small subunit